jgi:DNA-binding IclR family transcriptional regulator
MERDNGSGVKSLSRGLDILEHLASEGSVSFSGLLKSLQIPRSSLFHLLSNLEARQFVVRGGSSGGYSLGPAISGLMRTSGSPSPRACAGPILGRLSTAIEETCGFYVSVGDEVEVVASAISAQALSYTMKVGARAPLHAVSAGKIVLANMTDAELSKYFAQTRLAAVTPHTLTSKAALKRQIAEARRSGFAFSHEEFTPGITAVAVGVFKAGNLCGAMNVAVPSVRFTEQQGARIRMALGRAAAELGAALDESGSGQLAPR